MTVRRRLGLVMVVALAANLIAVSVGATQATPTAAPEPGAAVDLDVLFIGAHPDDEAFGLATYGQWNEYNDVQVGVITVTRGEGGGNAAGPEEGPALGFIREGEERRAVGRAGIEHIYNLDKVDYYYTVSAPLTEQVWGREETLEKVVRIVRTTRPDVIVTMNPSPTPGNHGHHQVAARLAVESFYAAADPAVFPEQISTEGLTAWRVEKLFRGGADGSGPPGPDCATTFEQAEPTDLVYGIWSGTPSERNDGLTWAQVEREGQREYVSQGWAVFPDVSTDPAELSCDRFTLVDSRVPFTLANTEPTAMLEGALMPAAGGLPLGTEFFLTTDTFYVVPGASLSVTAHARPAEGESLDSAAVTVTAPAGWTVDGDGALAAGASEGELTAEFTVTVGNDATPESRGLLEATLAAGDATGTTARAVQVVPVVRGTLHPLSQVAQFREWTADVGVPQLDNLIKARTSMGVGETKTIDVELTNYGDEPQSGQVTIELPEGFATETVSAPYADLAPEAAGTVSFAVTNADPTLATSNQGGAGGDFDFTITTESGAGSSAQTAALNLVPITTIPEADSPPTVDGEEATGEYDGPSLNLSRVWEGDAPETPADVAGTAKISWAGDALYMVVDVTDDTLGTVLPPGDAKRHWRTDSVEIAIDPLGTAENTSATFKVGVFPTTEDPVNQNPPAAYRDADAHQGPAAETAPELEVAAFVDEPYTGYTLEVKIPLAALPAPLDPENAAINIFIYDSDTQDLTGQTRLGWSTWRGVQGDPYRWGHADLIGMEPAADGATVEEPIMPLEVARSVDSPQSILQSATDGVPLSGGPAAAADASIDITSVTAADGAVTIDLNAAGTGSANLFVWDGTQAVASQAIALDAPGQQSVVLQVEGIDAAADLTLLVAFESSAGGTTSMAVPIER